MRKDDIIGQKLFETCKLSEFYLNLVVKCTNEDESPIQLARAYKQKLYEIVERYDRLLDANRQRQQLSLTLLDSNRHTRKIYQEANLSLTRTSTPSKTPTMTPSGVNPLFVTNYQQQQTPTQPLTPSSSFASTPTRRTISRGISPRFNTDKTRLRLVVVLSTRTTRLDIRVA